MKKYFYSVLCLGCVLLSACGGITKTQSTIITATPVKDDLETLPKNIQDMITANGKCYTVVEECSSDKNGNVITCRKDDLLKTSDEEATVAWSSYIITDLDQDDENELILWMNTDRLSKSVYIFDNQPDGVYAYGYPYRSIIRVYQDGVLFGSSGASDNQWYTLHFDKENVTETIVACMKGKADEILYYTEGTQVLEDEYYNYIETFNEETQIEQASYNF